MDFGYSPTVEQWRERVHAFLDEVIYPAEPTFHEQVRVSRVQPGDVGGGHRGQQLVGPAGGSKVGDLCGGSS